MNSFQQLLADLERLSEVHPDYSGRVNQDTHSDVFSLHHNSRPLSGKQLAAWRRFDRAIRALDQISPRIVAYLTNKKIDVPGKSQTPGAAVMAWALSDQIADPKYKKRFWALPVGTAFQAIRERLIQGPEVKSPKGNVKGKKVNGRMLAKMQEDNESRGWKLKEWASFLKCSEASVCNSRAWKHLKILRLQTKSEHALKAARGQRQRKRHVPKY